ncbi:MAG: ATP-binding response regulator, partial [Bacteroidales bacterium]
EGVGIEKEKMNSIFNFFTQGEIGLTRGYEGSGLGLSIAKGLTELLNGTISVESEKMKGTTVKLILGTEQKGQSAESFKRPEATLQGSKVLIAEDDMVNALYLNTILENAGINAITAANGQEAVEACQKNNDIGLVLMDIKMPVLGGLEATRQIKSFRPELLVIAVTAHALRGDEQKALEAGCSDYVAKPYNATALLKKVTYFIK